MIYKFTIEAVDRIFHDIIQVNKPFGKKIFIFGNNFYQVLPVISYASHADAVLANLY